MKIAILGTGVVGQTLAGRLAKPENDVIMGTRDVGQTLAKTEKNMYGGPSFAEWHAGNQHVKLGTFAGAAAVGELVINATQGSNTLQALALAGAENLKGKVLLDVSNPLDFSRGMPPTLIPEFCNTNSLGEEIQKNFPETRVVKALNTMWCGLMLNPGLIGKGMHDVYMCGNDATARALVVGLLQQFGWLPQHILDLGDITAARGMEMILPLWLRIMGTLGTGAFNFQVVK